MREGYKLAIEIFISIGLNLEKTMIKKTEGEILSQKAEKAMKKAVRGVIADRKMRGEPLIIWKNGKVVKIPASQLNKL